MNSQSRKGPAVPKAKSAALKKGENRISKKQPFEASEEYLKSLSEMIINPAECTEIVRSPADFAMVGDVKCFTRTFQLKATDLADGVNFSMTMSPSIQNFFSVSTSAALTSAVGLRGNSDGLSATDLLSDHFLGGSIDFWPVLNPTSPATTRISSQNHAGKIGFRITGGPGDILEMSFAPAYTTVLTVWFFDINTNTWLNMGTYFTDKNSAPWVPYTVPLGVNLEGIAIQCSAGIPSCSFDIRTTPGCTVPGDVHNHSLYSSDAVLLGRVERYRVTAMSMKVTYSGDFLNNGGVIVASRTQPTYVENDKPYDALTKLQDHKYQGAMVQGAYVWWLPYSYEEMDYRSVGVSPAKATQLRVAGEFANANGAVVVTLTCVVEFYSPLQIFCHEPGPFSSDQYLELLHALDRIPAATCNPSHSELFSSLWEKGVSAARSGVQFLLEHPEIALKLAGLLAI